MDHELRALNRRHDDHLKQVGRAIGADDEPPVRVLSSVFDDDRMVDGVIDVLVGDIVLARRRMNLHGCLAYYEIIDGRGVGSWPATHNASSPLTAMSATWPSPIEAARC